MDQLIEIVRVVVGTEFLTATVRIADDAPLMTAEDLEGTTRVYNLLPTIINHACVGDAGSTFKDCMGNTELAHLLEHVTIELLARTNLVDEVIAGRTWRELAYDRTYSIRIPCVDDVLVAGALSSGVWLMDWAFSGGYGPVPDVEATVAGLVQLVQSLPEPGQDVSADDDAQSVDPDRDGWEGDYGRDAYGGYDDGYDRDGRGDRGDYDAGYDDDGAYGDYEEDDLDRGPRMSRKIL